MSDNEEPLEIVGELRVETDASIWLIRPDAYMRLPKDERPRGQFRSEALLDGTWHAHAGAWILTDALGSRYRLLPVGRPSGARGIYTGYLRRPAEAGERPSDGPHR